MTDPAHRRPRARRRAALSASALAAAVAAGALPPVAGAEAAQPATARTLRVATDGSAPYRTVQSAIDAAALGDTVVIARGTYRGTIAVPAAERGLTLRGATGDAEDVVVTADRSAGDRRPDGSTYGTAGSAVAAFAADDLTVTGLTVENTYDRTAHPGATGTQAVALYASGDRQTYLNDRFVGHQDTVLNWAPDTTRRYRQYFRSCHLAGDVDFLFGNATAVYDRVTIDLLDRGARTGGTNGYLAAPNTEAAQPYGILVTGSTVRSTAAAGTYLLGRPWHPTASAKGQLVIRQSVLPAAVRATAPWTDMGGHGWRSARFAEYRNTGPGAGTGADRPQLTDAGAAAYTARRYLAGSDGWYPVR